MSTNQRHCVAMNEPMRGRVATVCHLLGNYKAFNNARGNLNFTS